METYFTFIPGTDWREPCRNVYRAIRVCASWAEAELDFDAVEFLVTTDHFGERIWGFSYVEHQLSLWFRPSHTAPWQLATKCDTPSDALLFVLNYHRVSL